MPEVRSILGDFPGDFLLGVTEKMGEKMIMVDTCVLSSSVRQRADREDTTVLSLCYVWEGDSSQDRLG